MSRFAWLTFIAAVVPSLWGLLVYLLIGRWLIRDAESWPEPEEEKVQAEFLDYQI